MTAKQLMLPAHRAFDSDGAPEAGATAHLYLSGTLTPALFYEDAALTVSLGSTITANEAGRFDPMPYQDSTIAFRIIIDDSEGAELDDIDPFYFGLVTGVDGISPAVATIADLKAVSIPTGNDKVRYLTQAGREGTFVFDSSNLSTLVTADPNNGIYVAPASASTGASGAWVRHPGIDTWIHAKWFGLANDGITNDGPTLLSVYALAFALAGSNLSGYGSAAPSIMLPFSPNGIIMGSTVVSLTKAIATYGETGGTFGGAATWLKWTGDCNGFEVRAQNCYFDGIGLKGSWTSGSPAEGEYHAIKGYQKFGYGRLYIDSWRGDGIHCNVSSGSGGDTEGNCNGIYGTVLNALNCRRGVSLEGNDSNAGSFGFINANYCRQAGVYEASGLGNAYNAIQTSGCGVQGYGTPGISFNNGHLFYVISGQETGASTNSPPATATSNTYWGYWKDAGAATAYAPQWTSGLAWRAGGAVLVPSAMASNATSIGYLYAENDQPPVQTAQGVLTKGGLTASGFASPSRYISTDYHGVVTSPHLYAKGNLTHEQGPNNQFLLDGTVKTVDTSFVMDSGNVADFMFFRIGGVTHTQIVTTPGTLTTWVNSHLFNTLGGTRLLSLDATAINLGVGMPLQSNGTTILNGTGVLQAAGVPAFAGGDVTSVGGTLSLTIPNGTITLAKQANMATGSLVYRKTAGAGAPEVQTLATLKTDLGLTGTNSGDQTSIVGITGTIAQFNTAITDADIVPTGLATASGLTMSTGKLLGRSTAATGAIEELSTVPAANFPALTGDVTTAGGALATTIANNVVTYAKFNQVAASSLVGNATGSLANATGITLAANLGFSGSTLRTQTSTNNVLLGRTTAGAGATEELTLAGGLSFSGTTITPTGGALAPASVAATGAITSSSATAGMGYATGAGGAVTQLTSKSTAPPAINKLCGQITMNNAALAAGAKVSFAVSNTSCAATDIPQVAVVSGGTANAYRANVTAVASNTFTVTVENITAGSLSEAPVIGFFINKAVTA